MSRRALLAFASFAVTLAFGFFFCAGLWLVTVTTYSFDRTVGGGTVLFAALGAIIATGVWVEAKP